MERAQVSKNLMPIDYTDSDPLEIETIHHQSISSNFNGMTATHLESLPYSDPSHKRLATNPLAGRERGATQGCRQFFTC
jgi:hypothetical protein